MSKNTRELWTDEDNYQISKAVLTEYVIEKSKKSKNEFIDDLLLHIPRKRLSIRDKVQNTKYLLENANIPNTLSIGALSHCSQVHCTQFDKARKDLNI